MAPLRVPLGERAYDIAFAPAGPPGDGFAAFVAGAAPRSGTAFVVTDPNARPHAEPLADALRGAGVRVGVAELPAGEAAKSLAEAARLYDAFAAFGADRGTLVVAAGGGAVGDSAGFAAATFHRGLPLLMVPTTLLAMVDSSVGGKVAVNHPSGKNAVGSFHQPAGVWVDLATLDTLPEREYVSGLAEVVKYGVALDAAFFEFLERNADAILSRDRASLRHVVTRSCELKAAVVAADEREVTGVRAVLNYGHTFAHAYEAVAGYGTWLHGEAVAAGMGAAARLAEALGRVPAEFAARQDALLTRLGLPTRPLPGWPADELLAAMGRDKKAVGGELRFVLPTRLGHAELATAPLGLVRGVLSA